MAIQKQVYCYLNYKCTKIFYGVQGWQRVSPALVETKSVI
jgi:hypothetical protein